MNTSIVLTVVADDQPGIVEELSDALATHGGNWTESSMMTLAGKFAGILLAEVPEERADSFLRVLESLEIGGNLVQSPPTGWNFYDWVAAWPSGVPPSCHNGFSGLLNWHLVYTLGLAAQLEEWAGESLIAQRWHDWRETLAAACKAGFWNEKQGLFADDLTHTQFSEHSQCLALLSGSLAGKQFSRTAQNLLSNTALTRTTIYFTHYLFETYRLLGQPEAFFSRMGLWFDLPAQGFKTTPEQPEPSRSDCHGWGAHPLYHYFASLLGIRPGGFGFETVEMAPMPGHLTHISGEMVHPKGQMGVNLHFDKGGVRGNVALPAGLDGILRFSGKTVVLKPGKQTIEL